MFSISNRRNASAARRSANGPFFSLSVFLLILLFNGCSSSPPETLPPSQPITGDSDEPEWVSRPWSVSEEGKSGKILYAVGHAPRNSDLSMQMEIARARARDELSRIVSLLVTAVTRDVRQTLTRAGRSGDGTTDQFSVIQSEQITQELLRGSRQVDGWRDSNEGYWVLVKLPLNEALSIYQESLLGQLKREGVPTEALGEIRKSAEEVIRTLMNKPAGEVGTPAAAANRGKSRSPALFPLNSCFVTTPPPPVPPAGRPPSGNRVRSQPAGTARSASGYCRRFVRNRSARCRDRARF